MSLWPPQREDQAKLDVRSGASPTGRSGRQTKSGASGSELLLVGKHVPDRVGAVLERRLVLHQVQAQAGELTFLADAGIGQPDRRHQVAVAEHRENSRVDLVGLACKRRETLDLLGVGNLDRPALLLKGVVD